MKTNKTDQSDEPRILDVIVGHDGSHQIWAHPSKRGASEFELVYKPFSPQMVRRIQEIQRRESREQDPEPLTTR